MKRGFLFLSVVLVVLMFATMSCDKAHSTSDGSIQGIYTVYGNGLMPEQTDTFYAVSNMKDFDLEHGDRAIITLGYEIDNLMGAGFAKWYIKSVDKMINTMPLTPLQSVDTVLYSSGIAGVGDFPMYGSHWMWKKFQSVYVGYYGNGNEGDFKLSPVKMSGDTLCFVLNSKFVAGDVPTAQLLSFDISNAVSMLSSTDAAKLLSLDSICTKITTKVDIVASDKVLNLSIGGGKYKKQF